MVFPPSSATGQVFTLNYEGTSWPGVNGSPLHQAGLYVNRVEPGTTPTNDTNAPYQIYYSESGTDPAFTLGYGTGNDRNSFSFVHVGTGNAGGILQILNNQTTAEGTVNLNVPLITSALSPDTFATLKIDNIFTGYNTIYNLDIPNTTSGGVIGVVYYGGIRFISNFGTRNEFIGSGAGNFTTTGADNIGIGNAVLPVLTTGMNNVALGNSNLQNISIGHGNVAIGTNSLAAITIGNNNIGIGINSGANYISTESNNILLANLGATGEDNTIRIGTVATQTSAFIAGVAGVSVSNTNMVTVNTVTGQLGSAAVPGGGGISTLDGDSGSATGSTVTIAGGSNISTTASGSAVTVDLVDSPSIAGTFSLPATSGSTVGVINFDSTRFIHDYGGTSNTFIGSSSGNFTLSGTNNVGVGFSTFFALTTGSRNVGIGQSALSHVNSGTDNVGVGNNILSALTNGSSNVGLGSGVLQSTLSSSSCFGLGTNSLSSLTSGNNNIGIGTSALTTLDSGSDNIAIGTAAGQLLTTTESDNIDIGNNGIAGDNGVIRIGTSGTQTTAFISGIRGVTTTNIDAVPVLIDSAGQLGTVSSSIRFKHNVKNMENETNALMKLRPVTFNFKSDKSNKKRFGLIAEEVESLIPELVYYDNGRIQGVHYEDLPVMLLNEIQRIASQLATLRRLLAAHSIS